MSILTFLDTVYDTVQHSQRYGGPTQLFNNQNAYRYQTLRYPLDVGSADKGHYMLFHINTQKKTQFSRDVVYGDRPTVIENTANLIKRRGEINFGGAFRTGVGVTQSGVSQLSNVFPSTSRFVSEISDSIQSYASSSLSRIAPTLGEAIPSFGGAIDSAVNGIYGDTFLRTIERTTEAIALYMPDTLTFEYRQNYDEMSLSKGIGHAGATIQSAIDSYRTSGGRGVGQNLAPFIAQYALGSFGDFARTLTAAGFGVVQNPMIEMLYSQPNLRTFQFDFMFYPRDEKEALEVQKIIESFKFHQAPEIKAYSGGYFLIPPSEFDIKFYYNGKINPNIDKISTCVLENVIVNYAPTGFSAYESLYEGSPSLGRTGMPVAIQMTLMFKETQIMTKGLYRNTDTGLRES